MTAYGRLQLWREVHKLGKRVLYFDTDSIIYIRDPDGYNIPQGHLLDEWEREKIDIQNEGIKLKLLLAWDQNHTHRKLGKMARLLLRRKVFL